jgi:hypothetical protein
MDEQLPQPGRTDDPWPPSQVWPAIRLFLLATAVLLAGGSVVTLVLIVLLVPLGPPGWVLLLLGLTAAFIAWFRWLMRLGTRVATVPARPGVVQVDATTLLGRIDAMGATGLALIDRVDATTRRITAAGPIEVEDSLDRRGLHQKRMQTRSAFQIQLAAGHAVAVEEGTVTTTSGVDIGATQIGAHWRRDWFRGVTMPVYDPQDPPLLSFGAHGWQCEDSFGLTTSDLRSALVEVICGSGWTYVPAFRLGRWSSVSTNG